jgi:hypothetical protein
MHGRELGQRRLPALDAQRDARPDDSSLAMTARMRSGRSGCGLDRPSSCSSMRSSYSSATGASAAQRSPAPLVAAASPRKSAPSALRECPQSSQRSERRQGRGAVGTERIVARVIAHRIVVFTPAAARLALAARAAILIAARHVVVISSAAALPPL